MKNPRRASRGQAAVELAVSLIIIMPLVFYSLFLADLTSYRLDQSEATFSVAWDFMVHDYNPKKPDVAPRGANNDPDKGAGVIDRVARINFCDHASHYNSYGTSMATDAKTNQQFETANECRDSHNKHHKASGAQGEGVNLAAHQCWYTGDAHQVGCTVTQDSYFTGVTMGFPLSMGRWNTRFNHGGHISCDAKLGVMNYFIPQQFFQQFSQVDMTNLERNTGLVHDDAKNATSQNSVIFPEDKFGLLQDTWAVTWPRDMNPDQVGVARYPYDNGNQNEIYERMKLHYDPMGLGYGGQAMQFGYKLVNKKLISPAAMLPPLGDNPMTPHLAFKAQPTDRKTNGFYPSAWGDNRVSQSSSSRRDQYFGWQNQNKW